MAQSNMRLGGQDAMARYFEQVTPTLVGSRPQRLKNLEGKGWKADAPKMLFSGSGVSRSTASLYGVGNTSIQTNSGAPTAPPDNMDQGCGQDTDGSGSGSGSASGP